MDVPKFFKVSQAGMPSAILLAGLVGYAHARGRVLSESEDLSFRNGQAASAAYTAGGTSEPCTGLYCQDNPLGNPCPCPFYKPCRHNNDGHCLNRVDIMGARHPDHECAYVTAGTWSAAFAGMENTGKAPPGNCMCTAGSTDIYSHKDWGVCDSKDPKWCECDVHTKVCKGNACPTPAPTPAPAVPTPQAAPSGSGSGAGGCKRQGKSTGTYKTTTRMVKGLKAKVGDCRDCSKTLKGTVDKTTVKTVSHWEIAN